MDINVTLLRFSLLNLTNKIPLQCNIFSSGVTRAAVAVPDYRRFWNFMFMWGRNGFQILKDTVRIKSTREFIPLHALCTYCLSFGDSHIFHILYNCTFYFSSLFLRLMKVSSCHIFPLCKEAPLNATKPSVIYYYRKKFHDVLGILKLDWPKPDRTICI